MFLSYLPLLIIYTKLFTLPIEITPTTKLISSGIIDSFSLVSLQLFIEREFGKKIPNPKMIAENCDTVDQLINLINQY